jgi:hypothetical protein
MGLFGLSRSAKEERSPQRTQRPQRTPFFFFLPGELRANQVSNAEDYHLSLRYFFLSACSASSAVNSSLAQPFLVSFLKDFLGREHPVYGRGKTRVHSHLDDDFNNLLA